jgi:hypothetical protein
MFHRQRNYRMVRKKRVLRGIGFFVERLKASTFASMLPFCYNPVILAVLSILPIACNP